jgi:citrate synthase
MKNNPVKTAITRIAPGEIDLRGHALVDLMGNHSFSEVIFLLLSGRLPQAHEARMLDAVLVSCVDHGVNAPSAFVARTVASCGSPVQTAIAAGISAVGEYHGGAGEACARLLQGTVARVGEAGLDTGAREIVQTYRSIGERLPGFGHRVHNPDPRADRLFALAQELGLWGAHSRLLIAVQAAWLDVVGKSLPVNVDGAIAGILSDLGFDWRLGKSFFIIARSAGLAAHVHEQITTGKPLQFAPPVETEFPPEVEAL